MFGAFNSKGQCAFYNVSGKSTQEGVRHAVLRRERGAHTDLHKNVKMQKYSAKCFSSEIMYDIHFLYSFLFSTVLNLACITFIMRRLIL